ncbi:MAG: WD40/YVTN/BNR-like repeat-containing protein [Ktedonobacterales bacterium]
MLNPPNDAHLQAAEGSEDGNLPAELEPVHQYLLAMGTVWRRSLPAADRIAAYIQGLPPHPVAFDSTEITNDLAEFGALAELVGSALRGESLMNVHHKDAMNSTDTRTDVKVVPARRQRLPAPFHTLMAVAAAVLVVGLLAATFAIFSHRSPSSVDASATPTLAPMSSWSPVASLSSNTTFALAAPAIAPSDPSIVYKVTTSPQLGLLRTADGGATWQSLSLPVLKYTAYQFMQLYVSPLNPNVVVLHTDGSTSQSSSNYCNYQADSWTVTASGNAATVPLAAVSAEVPTGPFVNCSQFLSTNGGRSWTQTSDFFDSARIVSAGGGPTGIFMVQDNRLYTYVGFNCQPSTANLATGVCSGGLLISLDGGMTWRPTSTPTSFCGVGMAPTGTVMFAITSPQCGAGNVPSDNTIWRSDDAGAHWTAVSHLQFSAVDDLRVVPNSSAAYPTVYLTTSNLANVQTPNITRTTQVRMSQDGGKMWTDVPTEGIAAAWSAIDVVAQTSNGSAIALFGPADSVGSDLYLWQPGGSSWQLVAPTPSTSPSLYLVTPSQDTPGAETLWAVTVGSATLGGVPYSTVVYRLQL